MKKFFLNIILLSLTAFYITDVKAQTLVVEDSISLLTVDTLVSENEFSKREARKIKQQIKIDNAGPFFSHDEKPGRKAALYALGLPGLGQIYNRKYWKLPIVYGAIGTTLFFTISNAKELKRYNTALGAELNGQTHEFSGIIGESELIRTRDFYRKNMELSAILTGLMWGLNIIDAVVDAHLFKFDISDDLSFQWAPHFLTGNNKTLPALHLSLNFN